MDEQTRQLLHDAAPPVATGTDFDRLWRQAVRQRRLQRVGQAAAAVVLAVVAGLVLPLGGTSSLPLLGRGGDGIEVEPLDDLRSAPLIEWDIVWTMGSRGGPMLGGGGQTYKLYVFAIEGGRWCVVGQPGGYDGDLAMGPVDDDLAGRLLCHEAKRPDADPIGTLGALRIGDRIVHWATLSPSVDRTGISADFGDGMTSILDAATYGGGGMPFVLWAVDTTGRTPLGFEVPDPTGRAEPVIIEAPEPLPAEVED